MHHQEREIFFPGVVATGPAQQIVDFPIAAQKITADSL
jgi:hypothetical protein